MNTNEPSRYIKTILLEILDRPALWLNKDKSKKFNIGTFDAQKAALSFLQQYKGWNFIKGQKINITYMDKQLNVIIRGLTYDNIDINLSQNHNTSVEFVYREILFCQIKWPNIIINNPKEYQSNTLQLLPISEDLSNREYQIIDNLHEVTQNENSTLEDKHEQEDHIHSTISIQINHNDIRI